jgi:hypothetical protein
MDAVGRLILLFFLFFYFSTRVLVSIKVDTNSSSLASTFKVDANGSSLASTLSGRRGGKGGSRGVEGGYMPTLDS